MNAVRHRRISKQLSIIAVTLCMLTLLTGASPVEASASQALPYDGDDVVAEYEDEDGDEDIDRRRYYWRMPGIDACIGFVDVDAQGAGTWYYYLTDQVGSVIAVVDSSGDIVNRYDYDAFGNLLPENTVETVPNRYRFHGREYDAERGDYYYRYRTYIPEWGAFTGPDLLIEMTDPMGAVNYTFCSNHPMQNIDPLGLWEPDPEMQRRMKYQAGMGICDPSGAGGTALGTFPPPVPSSPRAKLWSLRNPKQWAMSSLLDNFKNRYGGRGMGLLRWAAYKGYQLRKMKDSQPGNWTKVWYSQDLIRFGSSTTLDQASEGLMGTLEKMYAADRRQRELEFLIEGNGTSCLADVQVFLIYGLGGIGFKGVDEAIAGSTILNEDLAAGQRVWSGVTGTTQVLATVIPLGKGVAHLASKTGLGRAVYSSKWNPTLWGEKAAVNTVNAAARAAPNANDMHHAFAKAKHNLGDLVRHCGSEANVYRAVERATEAALKAQGTTSGVYSTTVKIGTEQLTVTGKIVDGVVRVGTFYK
jgi:RHS repeat-associated protein